MKKFLIGILTIISVLSFLVACNGSNTEYKVTFEINGQTEKVLTVKDGDTVDLSEIPTIPERIGYEGKWSVSDFSNFTSNTTISAIYTPIQYSIEFYLNGGELTEPFADAYTIESSVLLPTPERTDFVFLGWYDNEFFNGDQITQIHKGSIGNLVLYAHWQPQAQASYSINLINEGYLGAQLSGGGNYYKNDSVTITATANEEGYVFLGWFKSQVLVSDTQIFTFQMTAENIEYTAKWEKQKYTVTLISNTENILLIGGGEYEWGTTISISAEQDEKHIFVNWTDEHGAVISSNAYFEFEMPKKDITLSAVFEEEKYANELRLLTDANAGIVTGANFYYQGDYVVIDATSNDGYIFLGWYNGVDLLSQTARYTFVMPDFYVEYTAKWQKQNYSVTINNSDEMGTVTGEGDYQWGEQVSLTAVPNAGYIFLGYYEGIHLKESGLSYIFIMPKNQVELTTKWEQKKNSLTLESNIAEGGILEGAGEYAAGESVSITAIANEGYKFIGWYQDGQMVSAAPQYLVETKEYQLVYKAHFEKIKYNIKLINSDLGQGTVLGEGEFEWGTYVTITATSNDGYIFDGWQNESGIIGSYDNIFTFEMPKANITYTALWQEGTEGLTFSLLSDDTYAVSGIVIANNNLIIPATHRGKPVSAISGYAFSGKSFDSLSFARNSNILTIESNAFNSAIREIAFPNYKLDVENGAFSSSQVEELSNYSFEYGLALDRSKLIYVSLIDTVIPTNAFQNYSKLRQVNFVNKVKSIGDNSFGNCTLLNEIDLSGIEVIGNYAFSSSGITSVVVPNSVTSLGNGVFYNCKNLYSAYINAPINTLPNLSFSEADKLSIVNLSESIKTIGNDAFSGCVALTGINLPSNLTEIGENAFYSSGLEQISLTDTIVSIGAMAFGNCQNLESVVLPASLQNAALILFESSNIKSLTAPITSDLQGLQSYFSPNGREASSLKSFNINGGNIIGDNFFNVASNLEYIAISDTINSISLYAFNIINSSLKNIAVSQQNQSFVSVGGVLYTKDKTTLIKYPSSLTENHELDSKIQQIYPYALNGSAVTTARLPNVRIIGSYAFANCQDLYEIDLKDNIVLNEIGDNAFAYNDKIIELHVPASVSVIGEGILYQSTNIKRIAIPFVGQFGSGTGDTTFSYLFKAFNQVSSFEKLTSVEILGGSVVGDYAFNGLTQIEEVILPKYNLQSIGKQAFNGLYRVSSIEIPYGVEYIGEEALKGMSAVLQLFVPDTVEYIGANAFATMSKLSYIRIPFLGNSIDGGRFSDVFSTVAESCKVIVAGGKIGDYAFYNYSNITEIELPNDLTGIGDYAFKGVSKAEYLNIPKTVTSIGKEAFYGMESLKELTIPDGVDELQHKTLYGLNSLTKLTVPFVGSALNSPTDSSFSYIFGGGTYELRSYEYVPQSLKTVTVTGGSVISERAFEGLAYISSLTLPRSITSIKQGALFGMYNIEELVLPFIGTSEFEENQLYRLFNTNYSEIIPDSLKTLFIDRGVILNNSLSDYLQASPLLDIYIGNGVSFIDSDAFLTCKMLAQINVDDGNTEYSSDNGILFSKNFERLIKFPSQMAVSEFMLPSSVNQIEKNAFNGAFYLKNITTNSQLKSIGEYAFANSLIESAVFEGAYAIESLGESLFSNANKLSNIVLPFIPDDFQNVFALTSNSFSLKLNSGEEIYDYMFKDLSGLNHITLPNSLQYIGIYAFSGAGITALVIPDSVQTVGRGALAGRTLENLSLTMKQNWSLKEIFDEVSGELFVNITGNYPIYPSDAFNLRNLKGISVETSNIYYHTEDGVLYNKNKQVLIKYPAGKEGADFTVPLTVREISDYAFYYCSNLTSVNFEAGGNLNYLGSHIFANSALTNIELPTNLQHIGGYMFEYCQNLKSLSIPSNVEGIGQYAFSYSGLESVTFAFDSTLTAIDLGAFRGSKITNIELPAGVERLSSFVFENCRDLSSVTLNEGLLYIDSNVFFRNYSLQSITIPSTVIEIGTETFKESGLETILFIPDSNLEKIGISAFEKTMLKTVTLPDSLVRINTRAFADCSELWEIVLPKNITISSQSFIDTAIKSISIPDGAVIESSGLQIKHLETIIFGEDVTLNERAIADGQYLEMVVIPASIKMSKNAFYNLDSFFYIMTELATDSEEWAEGWHSNYKVYYGALYDSNDYFEYYKINEEYIVITAFIGQGDVIEIPSTILGISVKVIERKAFKETEAISIIIPLSVDTIKSGAFWYHSGTIFCEADEKPAGWQQGWNGSATIIWGYQA